MGEDDYSLFEILFPVKFWVHSGTGDAATELVVKGLISFEVSSPLSRLPGLTISSLRFRFFKMDFILELVGDRLLSAS